MTTQITPAAAKSLAVRYHACMEAMDASNDLGIIVWGEMLLEAQEETGVEMLDPENTRLMVRLARDRMAAIAA